MCETGWDETRSEKPTQLKSALNRATAEKNNPFGVHDQFTLVIEERIASASVSTQSEALCLPLAQKQRT